MKPMPFAITARREFAAAHQLRLYDGALEPLHGHNWVVVVTVAADRLDAIGVVMDLHELERLLDGVIGRLHNTHLNDVEPFKSELNPTTENVAVHIAVSLQLPPGVRVQSVEVWETAANSAIYRPL